MFGTHRISWIKTLIALFLIAGLPIFTWAVATQRIELRKRAADTTSICWNKVISPNEEYQWPDSCKGSPDTDQACAQILVPLTSEEITGYENWVSSGSPDIPGCGPAPSPAIPDECTSCETTGVCIEGLVCQLTVVIQGKCEANGLCNEPDRRLLCVKSDGSSKCPTTTPTPTQYYCDAGPCPAGYTCIRPPYPCPTGANGEPMTCAFRPYCKIIQPTPTPTCTPIPPCYYYEPRCALLSSINYCPPTTPTPAQRCTTNGASCTITICPTMSPCPLGAVCTQVMPTCTAQPGICQNNRCIPCTMPPPCAYTKPPCTYAVQGVTYCPRPTPTPTPTPPTGCYWKQVQCIQAPCPPILVCPSPTWYTTPTAAPTWYTTPTPTPTCTPYPPCYYPLTSDQPRCTLLGNVNYCPPMPIFTLSVNGAVPELLPNQVMPLTINVKEYDGSAGTPDEGFNVQAAVNVWPLLGNTPAVFSQNVVFNQNTQLWELTVPRPQNVGTYRLQVHAYCARDNSLCAIRYGQARQLEWTYYFSAVIPQPQNLTFKVKLTGVNGPEAKGAAINVKLKLKDGTVLPFDKPLVLNPVGNGVYEATATLTNPLPAGTAMRVLVKGEKHSQVVFCRMSGQTDQCNETEYMTPSTYSFDFTGRPLPPGDLNQNGRVNADDIKLITDLFKKPSTQLTPQDLKTADVDYSGTINGYDLNLVLLTLETRYDEQ